MARQTCPPSVVVSGAEEVALLSYLVANGYGKTKADAVRRAIRQLADSDRDMDLVKLLIRDIGNT